MTHRRPQRIARLAWLALLAGLAGGCAPEAPHPQTVTPTASAAPGSAEGQTLQPPRQIATH